jgi:hypothetical protein
MIGCVGQIAPIFTLAHIRKDVFNTYPFSVTHMLSGVCYNVEQHIIEEDISQDPLVLFFFSLLFFLELVKAVNFC